MKTGDMKLDMPKGGPRPGAGRPRKFGRALLSEQTLLHSTREQKAAWRAAANAEGKKLTDWGRDTLNKAAGIK